ncbi:sugar ABC transporter permease [Paenibacillus sabinae]|uniref:Maltose/maltodextrin transport system permease protein n=1 Tax=Paenibacillus sabinae T27 TaxID=1268072 RepID=X4ZIR9_9BACL|nr:sugar ABC transporter permease [Paenibacillus sabinae]AHV97237.1 binding-protein-dependent transport systems inner membrane component [Paenibacillus sabinae T27]
MQQLAVEREYPEHSRKFRKKAALLSALAMGLGQIYNKQYTKGILLLAFYAYGIFTAITSLPHALWALATLGETETHLKKVGRLYKQVMGDHSIFLMIEGLITVFIMLVLIWMYIASIKDAYRTGKLREEGIQPNTFKQTLSFVAAYRFPHIVLAIPLLGVVFFTVMPIIFMILVAFTDFTRDTMPPAHLINWEGLQAFKELLRNSSWSHTFYSVTIWTFVWAFFATVTGYFGGFAAALLVQQKGIRFRAFWRTAFILPFAIPMFVSTLILRNIFNGQFGPVNQYLGMLGISKAPWLSDPLWAKITLILANFWLTFPVSMLMIIGILSTIPKDMYEAADIDGASGFQKTRLITFPMVMFSMAPLIIMQFVGNINNFNIVYLLTNGKPLNGDFQFAGHTDILITWLFKLSMEQGKYNYASVIGIFIFIVLSAFAIWNVRRTKAFKEEEAS